MSDLTGDQETAPATAETADEIRLRNAALDRALRAVIAEVTPADLHAAPGDDEWTVAEILAHLAEFPRFFGGDLVAQIDGDAGPVGRTHEHSSRLVAIAAATGRSLEELRAELDATLDALSVQLARLDDGHLARVAEHRTAGPQTLGAFVRRYVLDHKAGHIRQLRETLERVRAS